MRQRDFLPELPSGHEVVEGRLGVLVCRTGWRAALLAAGLGPDEAFDPGAGTPELGEAPRGRQPVLLLPAGEATLVVRLYTHGGLLRWVTGDRFADPARPFRELVLADQLARRGVPTPEVLGARAQRAGSWGWRLSLVTRLVEDALDGGVVLRQCARGALSVSSKHAVTRTVGEFVGRLHSAGLWHADLTPNNILLGAELAKGQLPRCWILDLDRCCLHAELTGEQRAENLERFLRSVVKRQRDTPAGLDLSDAVRFLRGYAAGLGRPQDAWRADFRALARLLRRGRLAHGVSWFLERVLATGGPTRRASS